ncbi:hypothetical protein TYRP_006140 [Tyrophagus putrescentiae]|nr:hypothetical protein TYRP_006140 [Tyrophagus putrescentiae]
MENREKREYLSSQSTALPNSQSLALLQANKHKQNKRHLRRFDLSSSCVRSRIRFIFGVVAVAVADPPPGVRAPPTAPVRLLLLMSSLLSESEADRVPMPCCPRPPRRRLTACGGVPMGFVKRLIRLVVVVVVVGAGLLRGGAAALSVSKEVRGGSPAVLRLSSMMVVVVMVVVVVRAMVMAHSSPTPPLSSSEAFPRPPDEGPSSASSSSASFSSTASCSSRLRRLVAPPLLLLLLLGPP